MAEEKDKRKKLTLTVTTPRGVKFLEEATTVVMRGVNGNIGVKPGHEPVTTVLGDGILRIINGEREEMLAVFGGVARIQDTNIDIFTTIAQRPEEIDLERARRDREEAEQALQERSEDAFMVNAQAAIRRSLVRIKVSGGQYTGDDDFDENQNDG